MSGLYDWNPMPHVVDIRCPGCQARAPFEFAEAVAIGKAVVPYFRKSKHFEYVLQNDRTGHTHHYAVYFHGLVQSGLDNVVALPPGFGTDKWQHSPYLYRSRELDLGTVVCPRCSYRRKHKLNWPTEAFFQIEYRGQVLWAFHQESLQELIAYIASDDRRETRHKWAAFLRHVPSHFTAAKARASVVRRLEKLMSKA